MTRFLTGLLLMLLVLGLSVGALFAIDDPTTGVPAMARYYPEDTVVFAALRIDEGYIDELDALSNLGSSALASLDIAPFSLRESLGMATGVDVDAVLAFLGDRAAIGVTSIEPVLAAFTGGAGEPQDVYAVIEIDNRAAADEFLTGALPNAERDDSGDATVFTSEGGAVVLTLSDDLLVVTFAATPAPEFPTENTLADDARYAQTLENLRESSYNLLVYLNPVRLADLAAMGMPSGVQLQAAPLALGATLLNGDTLVIDTAQLPARGAEITMFDAVDPDFARFIPANANAVIHATNLTALYDTSFTTLDTLQEGTNQQSGFEQPLPSKQVNDALQMLGINLREDVLSWTTGDYAIFARAEIVPIVESALYNRFDAQDRFDFGIVMEATDPERADAFTRTLTELLTQAIPAGTEGVTISEEDIAGTTVTTVDLAVPIGGIMGSAAAGAPDETLDISLVLGTNRDVFIFATRGTAEAILAGGESLLDNARYQAAQTYVLPNPSSVWYTDGEGFLIGASGNVVVVVLALLGPSIGNVFDDIVASLMNQNTPTPSPTPTPTPTPDPEIIAAQVAPLQYAIDTLQNSTASATVTEDGVTLVRLTLTYTRP